MLVFRTTIVVEGKEVVRRATDRFSTPPIDVGFAQITIVLE